MRHIVRTHPFLSFKILAGRNVHATVAAADRGEVEAPDFKQGSGAFQPPGAALFAYFEAVKKPICLIFHTFFGHGKCLGMCE
jgi:hypothetical protein